MRVAKSPNGYISALKAELHDGPFHCPECRLEVILKKGDIYTHHFAHNPGEGCAFGEEDDGKHEAQFGESAFHRLAKKEIAQALASCVEVSNLKLERFCGSVRPDISFYYNDVPVVVEMQKSAIHDDVITRRTSEYARRGVYILWVSPFGDTEIHDGRMYTLRSWERILHGLYGGTTYYWTQEDRLLPVHFADKRTGESAHLHSYGPYIPSIGDPLHIRDLAPFVYIEQLPGETIYRETKLWGQPYLWVDAEKQYACIDECRERYPAQFPQVRPFPLLQNPFYVENASSDEARLGFVQETLPELQPLFQQFYEKYKQIDWKLLWGSVDTSPNMMYFGPDWWQRFRLEYIEANEQRKERLVEMLQEKLSGEKPSRYVKWP